MFLCLDIVLFALVFLTHFEKYVGFLGWFKFVILFPSFSFKDLNLPMPQTASVPYCFHSAPLCHSVLMFVSVVCLYFRLSLICKMYFRLNYDRHYFYVMIILFKKEKKKNKLVLEQFFLSRQWLNKHLPYNSITDVNMN